MDEQKKRLAQALEEKKKKKPEESMYTSLAKKGWLGTKAQISVEADERKKR